MTPATTARSGTYDDGPRRHNDCAWRDIGTTYAVEVAMPARTTTAGNRHGQLGPRLVKRRGRHCLSGGNTKKADSDEQSEGKYLGHAFLLWFWIVPPKYCANRIIIAFIAARRIQRRRKLSQLHEADKRMASLAYGRSWFNQQRVIVISRVPPLSDGTVLISLVVWQVSAAGGCET